MRIHTAPSWMKAMTCVIVLATISVVGQGCFFSGATSKRPDAAAALPDASVDLAILNCPAANSYQTNADPVLQTRCVSCHASGGPGSAKFLLIATSVATPDQVAANYAAAKAELDDTAQSPDDMPILYRPLGNAHDKVLSPDDDAYGQLRQWVTDEYSTPCDGSSANPAPAASGSPSGP